MQAGNCECSPKLAVAAPSAGHPFVRLRLETYSRAGRSRINKSVIISSIQLPQTGVKNLSAMPQPLVNQKEYAMQ